MPNDQFVQIPPASTGQKIDTSELIVSGNTVERQRMVVADDSSATGIAPVTAANGLLVDVSRVVGNVAVTNSGLTNLDVALSTRLKPADTLTGVTTVGTITNPVAVTNSGLTNLDVALSTRTKPADQQHTIVDSITAGSSILGKVGIDQTTPGTTNKVSLGSDVVHTIVDSGTISLPSNAAQETGGNLATAATQLTTLLGLLLAQGALATSATGPMVQGLVSDSPETYFDGYVRPISLTNDGRLRVSSSSSLNDEAIWGNFESDFRPEDFFPNNQELFF
jgi:hypothetical protein